MGISMPFSREARAARRAERRRLAAITYESRPHLLAIKPRERYIFHSDYFEIDGYVASILTYGHNLGASDNFAPFWGINLIPSDLPVGVTTVNLEQVERMGEDWISGHQTAAEGAVEMNAQAQSQTGTNRTRHQAGRAMGDLKQIAAELNDGAAYLNVQTRIMVKAPDVDALDEATSKIDRLYLDRFATISAAARPGRQRRELTDIFRSNRRKLGSGWYFTSVEYAGMYNLVTHGLEDADGEYVGHMIGDVNTSAIIFNADRYRDHVVVACDLYVEGADGSRDHVADRWGSKISQSAMCGGHRVVHIILDDQCDLDRLGPRLAASTSRVDMASGDLNMFEMFGDDELAAISIQMRKLVLMAEQAYHATDSDRSIIEGSLEAIATQFYVDNRMWWRNAQDNLDRLRVIGVPHEQVPTLAQFVLYLEQAYQAAVSSPASDPERVHALSVLSVTFNNLLANCGDLFNTRTNPAIDGAVSSRRVIYDFSGLVSRGVGVAMAQLVNVIGFAVGTLGRGDTVVLHGCELIDAGVHGYLEQQLSRLRDRGGRVAYLYNSTRAMLDDIDFCRLADSDYTVMGSMTRAVIDRYEDALGVTIPSDLTRLIMGIADPRRIYIRRGYDNVVFSEDLQLDPGSERNRRYLRDHGRRSI